MGTEGVEFTFRADQPQAGAFLRLLESTGERVDCVAVADGSGIVLTEKVWAAS